MASFLSFSFNSNDSQLSTPDSDVKCGFCLKQNEDLIESKTLPCGHIYCLSCLIGAHEVKGVVQCPTCGKVYNGSPSKLPLAGIGRRKPLNPCNVCKEKEKDEVPAVSYCDACKKMFCSKHQEYHDELMSDHDTQDLTNADREKETERICKRHKQQLSMGCSKCTATLCVECVDDMQACSGSKHSPVSMRRLYSDLKPKIEGLKRQISVRKDQILKLLKKTESVLGEQDDETEAMVQQLYTFREKEMKQVTDKYTHLQKQLQDGRRTNREKLREFKEQKLEVDLHFLAGKLMVIETSLAEEIEIDAVTAFREVENLLVSSDLPQLRLTESSQLQINDDNPSVVKVEVAVTIANEAEEENETSSLSPSARTAPPPSSTSTAVQRLTPRSAICTVCNKSSKKIFKLPCAHIVCNSCLIRLPGMLGRAMARCPICKPQRK